MISRQAADDPNNGDDANNGDARIAALETENRELREQQQRRKQQSSTSPHKAQTAKETKKQQRLFYGFKRV
ncbi:hypothetical protein QTG54_007323 [Skeletonema marinoi]|uniref:Uncharacterized protein n=1 Tax=Skeletonema marinoi TaxID=267567 RepID=A0AAD9DDG6_9STRA|nr:hypothetical protein QTG54_007323 [Skeletonema marinoi]